SGLRRTHVDEQRLPITLKTLRRPHERGCVANVYPDRSLLRLGIAERTEPLRSARATAARVHHQIGGEVLFTTAFARADDPHSGDPRARRVVEETSDVRLLEDFHARCPGDAAADLPLEQRSALAQKLHAALEARLPAAEVVPTGVPGHVQQVRASGAQLV